MKERTKTLGDRIRELRTEKDWSLREFGRRIGKTAPHLSDIENNRRNPSEEVLRSIASELDTTYEALKQYDQRVPVKELKRRANEEPTYGFALRRLAESDVSAQELLNILADRTDKRED